MNYDSEIQALIDAIKADKSIVQPWRNYALKAANELQAFVRMGLTTTNRLVSNGTLLDGTSLIGKKGQAEYDDMLSQSCTCPAGGIRRDCPVHGGQA